MMETLTAIRRAGADIIITYYARDAARLLAARRSTTAASRLADASRAREASSVSATA